MHKNIGMTDMFIRLIIGANFLYLGFFSNSIITNGIPKKIIALFGIIVTISAILRNCPLYYLAGIDTNTKKED